MVEADMWDTRFFFSIYKKGKHDFFSNFFLFSLKNKKNKKYYNIYTLGNDILLSLRVMMFYF